MLRVRASWLRLPCSSTVGTPLVELAGQRLGAVLGAGEDHGAARRAGQVDQHRHALLAGDVQHVVVHRGDRRLGRVGLVGHGLVEELLDQHVDAVVEGGREQQPLALAGRRVQEAAHGGQEAEVGHVVGLVEDGDLDRAEVAVTLLDQVLEAAGAGQHDVDAVAQAGDLRVLADAAEDGPGGQAGGLGQRLEGLLDLADQLAGRGQDQGAGAAGGRAATGGARGGPPAAAGTRRSCRSRCGRGRGRRGRPASRAGSRPGSAWGR